MISTVIASELSIERVVHQIGGLPLQVFVRLNFAGVIHPFVQRMPKAFSGRMRVAGLIGLLVVLSVNTNPDDGRAHQCEIATGANDILEPFGHRQRLVSQQAMVTQSNSHSMPVMPKNRPGDYYQTGRKYGVVKDAQSEFLSVSQ
jgi:hypothetical protein